MRDIYSYNKKVWKCWEEEFISIRVTRSFFAGNSCYCPNHQVSDSLWRHTSRPHNQTSRRLGSSYPLLTVSCLLKALHQICCRCHNFAAPTYHRFLLKCELQRPEYSRNTQMNRAAYLSRPSSLEFWLATGNLTQCSYKLPYCIHYYKFKTLHVMHCM